MLAQVPEGPPARFTWRRVTRRVVKAEGPERIAPEWWRELVTPSPGKGEGGDGHRPSPGGGHVASSVRSNPHPGPPPSRGREIRATPRDYYRIEDEEGRRYWVFREGLYQGAARQICLPGICTGCSGDGALKQRSGSAIKMTPRYAELDVTTNFSFLRGGSHPEELVATAKALGLAAIAVTDRNTLAGVVRAHLAAREVGGIKFIVGARLDLEDAPSLLAYPTDRAAYGRLCRLLTLGQRRAEKGKCTLHLADVAAHAEGLIFIALP